MADRPRRALIFSGGGARGAYEAGVVRYLVDELPRRLGRPVRFDVIGGTSVGAIHACYLAGTADNPPDRASRLIDFWTSLKIDEVLPFSARDLMSLGRRLIGMGSTSKAIRGGEAPPRLHGLLNTQQLERTVVRAIPWRGIRSNVQNGNLDAVCVAATEVGTGRVVAFIESRDQSVSRWSRDPNLVPRFTHLRPSHALASAAIPVLFPIVRVAGSYYADGGLRLNTPLAPVLRLGADKILVVALRPEVRHWDEAIHSDRIEHYANPAFLFGKVLNALLLDHLDTDLARMQVINELLEQGKETFGDNFLERLNDNPRSGQRFRHIEHLVIRPSADLGVLAGQLLQDLPGASDRSPFFRLAMRNLVPGQRSAEADLLSYLLFDGEFLGPLIDLGLRDARAREEELAAFFSDP